MVFPVFRKLNLLRSLLNVMPPRELTVQIDEVPVKLGDKDHHAAKKHHSHVGLHAKMPLSAIAGLNGLDAEKFIDYKMDNERLIPITHCWTPAGDILVGCLDGELLKVGEEKLSTYFFNC